MLRAEENTVKRFREPILRIAGVRGAFAETAFMTRHYGVAAKAIHPNVRMGHVHLKVSDLERALGFYRDVLGFELTQRFGSSAAFLSAGGYHHHIGLNTWESEGGRPPAEGTTGLYHLAILYPTRAELGDALRRLQKAGVPLEGASDHGVSEALYLRDPDGNGVELYWDRPKDEWPRTSDGLAMYTRPLDLNSLLATGSEDVMRGD
ncbi:MAG: catechol 2,3-dioxygenase [Verrucomicrobiota bacterium]|jgi:catechol 2,3-dioxygenase